MERNDLIFRNVQPYLVAYKALFKKKFALIVIRAEETLKFPVTLWIDWSM